MTLLKNKTGRVNSVTLSDGTVVNRQTHFIYKVGETVRLYPTIDDDDDHFLYEKNRVISKEEYEHYQRKGQPIPETRLGPVLMCTCGSMGVLILDAKAPPPINEHLVCQSVAQFGIHQTSMIRSGNKIALPKKIAQDYLLSDAELEKRYHDSN
jgi:hypothetical protein